MKPDSIWSPAPCHPRRLKDAGPSQGLLSAPRPARRLQPLYLLRMRRGKRSVTIALAFSRSRAEALAESLDWSGDWKPEITQTDKGCL